MVITVTANSPSPLLSKTVVPRKLWAQGLQEDVWIMVQPKRDWFSASQSHLDVEVRNLWPKDPPENHSGGLGGGPGPPSQRVEPSVRPAASEQVGQW